MVEKCKGNVVKGNTMLENVNRNVLIIFPKKPFMDWVNYIFPEKKHECPKPLKHDAGNVYLIPQFDNLQKAVHFLKINYKEYFENELQDWTTKKNDWPHDLSWELFDNWFHYSIQTVIIDTVNDTIKKEEF